MDKKTDISYKNLIANFDFASLYPSSFTIKLSSKESIIKKYEDILEEIKKINPNDINNLE